MTWPCSKSNEARGKGAQQRSRWGTGSHQTLSKERKKGGLHSPLRIYINVRELVGEGVPRSVHSPHFAFLCVLLLYLNALHPSDINHVLL